MLSIKHNAMSTEGSKITSRIKNLLRSPSIRLRRDKPGAMGNPVNKVTLERVLGITALGSSSLTSDPHTGLVAYPAGCVVVLLDPRKSTQQHIINTSRKTITTVNFSPDGKYLVTGESGHLPAVRVWDVAERTQLAVLQGHSHGVACVAFSPSSKYIVSVGHQHDMSINVWAWKRNTVVATNKVSSRVMAVAFSEDSSYFVTVGNRHVRFWYLNFSSSSKVTAPLPLVGRSGLLGDHWNSCFCAVACGRGDKATSTFCITSSGLLCEFNQHRLLDKWVDLRTSVASALCVSEELVACACADGTVHIFSPSDLRFVCTLPRPHRLGTDVTPITHASRPDERHPDTVAVAYDPVNGLLSCVYNDHSIYVWDVRAPQLVGKVHSALYHSGCVWDIQMHPKNTERSEVGSYSRVFLTCSADGTVRMWSSEGHKAQSHPNALSNDLLKVTYVDHNTAATSCSADKFDGPTAECRGGIRTICVSPDGKHLASGDRSGTLRVHDLGSMEEILKVEAHNSEITCLEYSKPETGLKVLATASRDRLIHVLDAEQDYSLLQTLDEHSAAITAIRFAANEGKARLISCGADKSVYVRTAQRTPKGTEFQRTHHVVRKASWHDMDVDPTCKYAAVGCQDRSIRVFNISSAKQKRSYKGSQTEEGSLLKVQIDPSGLYVATSCSDKNISLFDFQSGECLAAMFGHSEAVTGLKFTEDCKRLISVSGDSCIFVWSLPPEMTVNMRARLAQLRHPPNGLQISALRLPLFSESDKDEEEEGGEDAGEFMVERPPDDLPEVSHQTEQGHIDDASYIKADACGGAFLAEPPLTKEPPQRRRRRWSGRMEQATKSMLELRHLETPRTGSPGRSPRGRLSAKELGRSSSLKGATDMNARILKRHSRPLSAWLLPSAKPEPEGVVLYQELGAGPSCLPARVWGSALLQGPGEEAPCRDGQSSDSACSLGYSSGASSPEPHCEVASEGPGCLSSDEEEEDEEEEELAEERFFRQAGSPGQKVLQREPCQAVAGSTFTGKQSHLQHSASSYYLAQVSPVRTAGGKDGGLGGAVGPPVSAVQPLMKDGGPWECVEAGAGRGPLLRSTPQRKRAPSPPYSQGARTPSRPPADARRPLTPCKLRGAQLKPTLEDSDPKPLLCHLSCPALSPSGSWGSPCARSALKARSYMSPTTSSRAKISRSVSLGEGLPTATPTPLDPWAGPLPCWSPGSLSTLRPQPLPSPSSTQPMSPSPSGPDLGNRGVFTLPSKGLEPPLPANASLLEWGSTRTLSPTWDAAPFPDVFDGTNQAVCPELGTLRLGADANLTPAVPGAGCESALSGSLEVEGHSQTVQQRPAAKHERPLLAVQAFSVMGDGYASAEPPVTIERCRQVAAELYSSVRRTTELYHEVSSHSAAGSAEQQEMERVLLEALAVVRCEVALDGGGLGGGGGGQGALALLEQYSQLLLQSVEKRLHLQH